MIELTEWIRSTHFDPKPWLLLGKGPTFSRRDDFDLTGYNLMGLNHVVNEVRVDVAHIIDFHGLQAYGDRLLTNCEYLVVPRRPVMRRRPSLHLLEDFFATEPVLRELDACGRLVWYNALDPYWSKRGWCPPVGESPPITVQGFSSQAALAILAEMGVRQVRSLGIDGGRSYSGPFQSLARTGMLRDASAGYSYDAQFEAMEATIEAHGLDYRPLVAPLQVVIVAGQAELVAARVLEHTIRKHTTRPVRVEVTPDPDARPPTDDDRVLYLAAGAVAFADIEQLWKLPFDGAGALATQEAGQAVRLVDTSRGRCGTDDVSATLAPEWGHVERYEPGHTKLLHYTASGQAPWKSDGHPLAGIWMSCYEEAVAAGAIAVAEVERLVTKGLVKRPLASCLDRAPAATAMPNSLSLELEATQVRVDHLERTLAAVESSAELRLGRALLRPLRWVRTRVGAGRRRS